jgi:hypothetical protein
MTKNDKVVAAVKAAIDEKLHELYAANNGKITAEMRTLEYLMCLIEQDPDSPDYANSCIVKMYG